MENYNWGRGCNGCETDHGPKPFVTNIMRVARQNQNFRTAFWTGCHLQMTLMCIPPCGEIGVEMHPDTDQFIRVEEGQALGPHGRLQRKSGLPMPHRYGGCHLCTGRNMAQCFQHWKWSAETLIFLRAASTSKRYHSPYKGRFRKQRALTLLLNQHWLN